MKMWRRIMKIWIEKSKWKEEMKDENKERK